MGPSPWAFRNRSFTHQGTTYQFQEIAPKSGTFSGLTALQDSNGATLIIFDFQCYISVNDDGFVLLWRELRDIKQNEVVFDSFDLSTLRPLSMPLVTATALRLKKSGISPLPDSQHWQFSSSLEFGTHSFSIPHDWSRFGETLVLANYAESNGYDKMARAIFAFDWQKRRVEIFPQDWFNLGNYDFGYQWITRVARQKDGSIVGDGIRLGTFELDATNRQVKKWHAQDAFYILQ